MKALTLLFLIALAASLQAADPDATKMRDQLRNTIIQLRTAETERATLQAEKADLEQKNKDQEAQVAKLIKEATATKEATDKSLKELTEKLADREVEIARSKADLEISQANHKKTAELATVTEAKRVKLAGQVILLQRQVADQQMKNAEMFKIGNEILDRYKKFSLGEALSAREPFTGITRVKLQNQFQDTSDALVDAKIRPGEKPQAQSSTHSGQAANANAEPNTAPQKQKP